MMTDQFVKFLTSFYLNLNSGPAGDVTCGLVQIPLLPGPQGPADGICRELHISTRAGL